MKKFGNAMALTKHQAEWLIRSALSDLNSANRRIEQLNIIVKSGVAVDNADFTDVLNNSMVDAVGKRQQAIKMLGFILDADDRKALVKAFSIDPKSVDYEDFEAFCDWLLVAAIQRSVYMDVFVPYKNEIVFSVI